MDGPPPKRNALEASGHVATAYPEAFARRLAGLRKRAADGEFDVVDFGVRQTTLGPGCRAALRHGQTHRDEFVYVLQGELVLADDDGELTLLKGTCTGLRAGAKGQHVVNRTGKEAVYLEIGDRLPGEDAGQSEDDLIAEHDGTNWNFRRRNDDQI